MKRRRFIEEQIIWIMRQVQGGRQHPREIRSVHFGNLFEAGIILMAKKIDFNESRPHCSLGLPIVGGARAARHNSGLS